MVKLCTRILIFASPERCFNLARSVDVHTISASPIHGKAIAGRTAGLSAGGDWTTWSARFFCMRFSLTTAITNFDPPYSFSDTLRRGLFTDFGHVYRFEMKGIEQTMMTDAFSFQSPFGFLGAFFDTVFLRPRMQKTLDFRALSIKRIAESDEWRAYL